VDCSWGTGAPGRRTAPPSWWCRGAGRFDRWSPRVLRDRTRHPRLVGSRTDACCWAPRFAQLPRALDLVAMHAPTLDHLSGGRAVLVAGRVGPRVVRVGTAPVRQTVADTREYVRSFRQVSPEAPVTNAGRTTRCPTPGPARRPGPATRPITTRCVLTCRSGWARGSQNVALTARLPWLLALFYRPARGHLSGVAGRWPVRRGRGAPRRVHRGGSCSVVVTDEPGRDGPGQALPALYWAEWARRGRTSTPRVLPDGL